MRSGQSAIELLTTYGWAIIIVLAVLAIMVTLGLFTNPLPSICTFPGDVNCKVYMINSSGTLALELGQATDHPIKILALRCTQENNVVLNETDALPQSIPIPRGGSVLITNGSQRCLSMQNGVAVPVTGSPTSMYKGKVYIAYEEVDTGSRHVVVGDVQLKYEDVALPTPLPTATPTPRATPTPTPSPTATPTPRPTATPTPSPTVTPTPTPTSTATPVATPTPTPRPTATPTPAPAPTPTPLPTPTPGPITDGWIDVPGNPAIGTSDFKTMKFEAKNDGTGTAASMAAGTPWVLITQIDARAECAAIGAHLMTAKEAQTISINVVAQPSNWMSGVVGTGCMYGGHMECTSDLMACFAVLNASTNDSQAYWNGTSAVWDPAVQNCPFVGTGGRGNETRRTYTLSNGQIIWDWSGNAYELLNDTYLVGTGVGYWYDSGVSYGYSMINWTDPNLQDYERLQLGPANASWTNAKGIGMYIAGDLANDKVFAHGGDVDDAELAGAFALDLSIAADQPDVHSGFRCVK